MQNCNNENIRWFYFVNDVMLRFHLFEIVSFLCVEIEDMETLFLFMKQSVTCQHAGGRRRSSRSSASFPHHGPVMQLHFIFETVGDPTNSRIEWK